MANETQTKNPTVGDFVKKPAGDEKAKADAEAAEKAKAEKPRPRLFVCEAKRGLVVAPGGRRRAVFTDGELVTDDPIVIEVCRKLDYVTEVRS